MAWIIAEVSKWAVPLLLLIIPVMAYVRKVKVYEAFVEGAEQGFHTAIKIIPFLIGMLVAIGVFRASGAMEILINFLTPLMVLIGVPAEVLPLVFMRPLSGGGALGITAELIHTYGADSFIGRLASTIQGSTDTTFFVLTVYFGSVGIRRYRHALTVGLLADLTGFLASLYIVTLVFG